MQGHDTRFQTGQSGNPGGRKAIPEELKNRLRNLSEKAVDALEQALDSNDHRVRIQAAPVLLDRAYGKPPQQHEVTETVDVGQAHLAALVEAAKRRPERRERERAEASVNANAAAAGTALVPPRRSLNTPYRASILPGGLAIEDALPLPLSMPGSLPRKKNKIAALLVACSVEALHRVVGDVVAHHLFAMRHVHDQDTARGLKSG